MAVADRGDPELCQAIRRAGHLARVALPLADSDVLVRAAVGQPVSAVCGRDLRDRYSDRLAAVGDRQPLVHLPNRARLARPQGPAADVRRISAHAPGANDRWETRVPVSISR